MADIVLRDRNGKEVQYPGVNYLKIKTVDGNTQGFATYDPETLKAENIKTGVEIGDVVGKILIPDREEKTVDLDFSKGNIMTVMPSNNNELLFDKSGVTFAPNPAAYNMCLAMDASGFAFEVGSEYQVHWDGTVHNCVAYDAAPIDTLVGGTGSVAIGNGTVFGLQGNNEPFVFGTVLIGGSRMVILNSLLDTAESTHDVKIYKKIDGGNEKLLSKVDIVKPENLKPENIVKDVDIAGVIGTMDSGGGSDCLVVFNTYSMKYRNTSKSNSVVPTASITLPPNSIILSWSIGDHSSYASTSTSFSTGRPKQSSSKPTISVADTGVTVSATGPTFGISGSTAHIFLLSVTFSVLGLYIREGERLEIYADETFEKFPETSNMNVDAEAADLSKSKITTLPSYVFRNTALKEIILPSTLTEISTYVFPADCEVIDMTRLSAVPTLSSTNSISGNDNLQIKVPAAIYDEWIAATSWSSLASYIVAV